METDGLKTNRLHEDSVPADRRLDDAFAFHGINLCPVDRELVCQHISAG